MSNKSAEFNANTPRDVLEKELEGIRNALVETPGNVDLLRECARLNQLLNPDQSDDNLQN